MFVALMKEIAQPTTEFLHVSTTNNNIFITRHFELLEFSNWDSNLGYVIFITSALFYIINYLLPRVVNRIFVLLRKMLISLSYSAVKFEEGYLLVFVDSQ